MIVKSIRFSRYKSIVDPINLDFCSPMITFIGKNGSGKTNILDAIYQIFHPDNYQDKEDMDYHIFLELEEHEIKRYLSLVEITKETNIIDAYRDGHSNRPILQINRIKAPFLNDMLSSLESSIYDLATKFYASMTKFNEIVSKLASKNLNEVSMSVEVEFVEADLKTSTNYGWQFEHMKVNIDRTLDDIRSIIKERVHEDTLVFQGHYLSTNHLLYTRPFKLEYSRPKLTKFEKKYITIDEEGIKKEIRRINKATTKHQNDMRDVYTQLKAQIDTFNAIIDGHDNHLIEENSHFESLWTTIIRTCTPKVYYLTNESSQLLFKRPNEWSSRHYSLNERMIIETYVKFKYAEIYHKYDSKSIEDWKISSSEMTQLATEMERFINANLPNYERDMIQKIQVNDELAISIVEKNGDIVPLNQANSGRRWYFTYFFVKGCLRPGDILILDEPASNLHPEAQIQILKDIEETAKYNKVIWSTHSPYLISPNSTVYYVKMEDGSRIYDCQNMQLQSMMSEMGVRNLNMLVGDALINNTLLPMEQIGANLKARLKEKKINQAKLARSRNMNPSNFYKKLKGEFLTIDDIQWICTECKIDIVEVMFIQK